MDNSNPSASRPELTGPKRLSHLEKRERARQLAEERGRPYNPNYSKIKRRRNKAEEDRLKAEDEAKKMSPEALEEKRKAQTLEDEEKAETEFVDKINIHKENIDNFLISSGSIM